MKKALKSYDRQFKIDTVEYYLNSGQTARSIAKHFGICDKTFYSWIKEYKEQSSDSFKGKGFIKSSNEEVVKLKKALASVKQERDILKKALAIFSAPNK